MPNGVPMPMQPSEPGSSYVARRQADAREAQEVAAVGDDHGVGRQRVAAPRRADGSGCMRPSLAGRRVAIVGEQLLGALLVLRAQALRPVAIGRRRRLPAASTIAASAGAGVARISTAPRRLSRSSEARIGDAHESRRAEDRGRAVRELEVEPAADRHDDVGLAHHVPRIAATTEDGRPARGRGSRRCRGRARRAVEQPHELGPGAAGAAPADDERPPRRPQQVDRRATARGSGRISGVGFGAKCSASCSGRGTSPRSVSVGKSR